MKTENETIEKLTVLQFLCIHLHWQGGTIHQALQAVKDLPDNNAYPHRSHIAFSLAAMENSELIDRQSAGYEKLKSLLK